MKHIIILLLLACLGASAFPQDRFLVKIRLDEQKSLSMLADMNLDMVSEHPGATSDAVVTGAELLELTRRGFKTDYLPMDPPGVNITQYRSYQEVVDLLNSFMVTYSRIMILDTLGYSQTLHMMIPVVKISDNPGLEEDEPAILFDGLHHAREPVGMECTLSILEYLLRNYGGDPKVTSWVNDNEIWFIPMINPEGYKYLVDNNLSSPWWRKNLHDNNGNGAIDQNYDGVDLNRNYSWGWSSGGSNNPGDWVYRGTAPFSESETDAKRKWALVQKPVLSLSYHSYGEQLLYAWSGEPRSPDHDLIVEIGDSIAKKIPKTGTSGHYSVDPSECTTGYSKCYMYGKIGTIEYTVETANQFVPPVDIGMQVARENMTGALYLFDRIQGPGITGRIRDAKSGLPLVARVRIKELAEERVQPRMSEPQFGRYYRLLQPGSYTVEISRTGYVTQTLSSFSVPTGKMVSLNIDLQPVASGIDDFYMGSDQTVCTGARIYPNPLRDQAFIEFQLNTSTPVTIRIMDLTGREVARVYNGEMVPGIHQVSWNGTGKSGNPVKAGMYLCLIETKGGVSRMAVVME